MIVSAGCNLAFYAFQKEETRTKKWKMNLADIFVQQYFTFWIAKKEGDEIDSWGKIWEPKWRFCLIFPRVFNFLTLIEP